MVVFFVHAYASTEYFAILCFGKIVLYCGNCISWCLPVVSGLRDTMTTETSVFCGQYNVLKFWAEGSSKNKTINKEDWK